MVRLPIYWVVVVFDQVKCSAIVLWNWCH